MESKREEETEVRNLSVQVAVEEDVAGGEVSVRDPAGLEELHAAADVAAHIHVHVQIDVRAQIHELNRSLLSLTASLRVQFQSLPSRLPVFPWESSVYYYPVH